MEPRIQYAQTKDGVSIAFTTLGEGMPLVYMLGLPWSHIQMEWQWPSIRRLYERQSQTRRLIRFDIRGSGSSDRDVTDFSLDSYILDIEAVVDLLGLETFALCGYGHSGPLAIAYAARHPERVSHLILLCSYARAADAFRTPEGEAFRALRERDWKIYTEAVAHVVLGWTTGEESHQFAGFLRECVTQEVAQAAHRAIEAFDVTDLLPQVQSPTLALHHRQVHWPPVNLSRALAAHIPSARLVVLEGTPGLSFLGDTEAVASAIDEFLGEGEEATAGAAPSGLVTILFTDMEGSTTLTQRLGDARAQEVLRTHNTIVRDALKAHEGSETKHTGDGIMASFSSATRALESAIAMQRAFAEHNQSAAEPIGVRIGLNAGEPVAEEKDLFGTAVQLAARICAHAEPGQILVPIVVRELAAGKKFLFADLGETVLRGFEDPVRLFEVSWREEG